jgi:hypothetical protein
MLTIGKGDESRAFSEVREDGESRDLGRVASEGRRQPPGVGVAVGPHHIGCAGDAAKHPLLQRFDPERAAGDRAARVEFMKHRDQRNGGITLPELSEHGQQPDRRAAFRKTVSGPLQHHRLRLLSGRAHQAQEGVGFAAGYLGGRESDRGRRNLGLRITCDEMGVDLMPGFQGSGENGRLITHATDCGREAGQDLNDAGHAGRGEPVSSFRDST